MTGRSGTCKPICAGTVVVLTGASAGVGRAVARFAHGRDGARRDVEATGGRAFALSVDVADASAVEEAASR